MNSFCGRLIRSACIWFLGLSSFTVHGFISHLQRGCRLVLTAQHAAGYAIPPLESSQQPDKKVSWTRNEEMIQVVRLAESQDGDSSSRDATPESEQQPSDTASQNERVGKPSASTESSKGKSSVSDDDLDIRAQKQKDMVKRAALLGRGKRARSLASRTSSKKATSVGLRREGSASRARNQPGSTSKIADVLRKAARGSAAAAAEAQPDKSTEQTSSGPDSSSSEGSRPSGDDKSPSNHFKATAATTLAAPVAIQSAIGEFIGTAKTVTNNKSTQKERFLAAVSPVGLPSAGVLGEPQDVRASLSAPLVSSSDGTYVRLATPMDDLDIANLRLSVFSDFSFDQRGQFCARSCQAISYRRKRGAVCLVATKGEGVRPRIRGTAECSFHEFYGTKLGQRRPRCSVLYVTEVAVHPSIRRQGVGSILMRGIDSFAATRQIETVYLHVDVQNDGAISLYEQRGYRRVDTAEPIFADFTKSLNLHPGATKGRSHHLLFKDISRATWLPHETPPATSEPQRVVGQLGFEIPA